MLKKNHYLLLTLCLPIWVGGCSFMVDENVDDTGFDPDAGFDLNRGEEDDDEDTEPVMDAGTADDDEEELIEVDDFSETLVDDANIAMLVDLPRSLTAFTSFIGSDSETHVYALDGLQIINLGTWPDLDQDTVVYDLTSDIVAGPYADQADCDGGTCFINDFLRISDSHLIVGYTVADANFNGEILIYDFDDGQINGLSRYVAPGNYAADVHPGSEAEADMLFVNSNGFRGMTETNSMFALNLETDSAIYLVEYPAIATAAGGLSAGNQIIYAGYFASTNRLSAFDPIELRSFIGPDHIVDDIDVPNSFLNDIISVSTSTISGEDLSIFQQSQDFMTTVGVYVTTTDPALEAVQRSQADDVNPIMVWPMDNSRCGDIIDTFALDGVGVGLVITGCDGAGTQLVQIELATNI